MLWCVQKLLCLAEKVFPGNNFFFQKYYWNFQSFFKEHSFNKHQSFSEKKSFRTERKSANCKTDRGLISDHFSLNKCVRHIILCLIKKPRSKIYKAYNDVMKFQSDIIIFLSSRNSSFIDFSLKQKFDPIYKVRLLTLLRTS